MSLSSLPELPRRNPRTATLPSPGWFHATHNSIQLYFQHSYGISSITFGHLRHDHDTRFPYTTHGRLGNWAWLESLDGYSSRLGSEEPDEDEDMRIWRAHELRERRREQRRAERVDRELEDGECLEGEMAVVEDGRLQGDGDVVMGDTLGKDNLSERRPGRGNVCGSGEVDVEVKIPRIGTRELATLPE